MNFFKRIFKRKNIVEKTIKGLKNMDLESLNKISKELKKIIVNKKFDRLAGANKETMERFGENFFLGKSEKLGTYYDPELETVDPKEKTLENLLSEHGFDDPRMDKLVKKVIKAKTESK